MTEQGLNAFDTRGVTIKKLTVVLCPLIQVVHVLIPNTGAVQILSGTVIPLIKCVSEKMVTQVGG